MMLSFFVFFFLFFLLLLSLHLHSLPFFVLLSRSLPLRPHLFSFIPDNVTNKVPTRPSSTCLPTSMFVSVLRFLFVYHFWSCMPIVVVSTYSISVPSVTKSSSVRIFGSRKDRQKFAYSFCEKQVVCAAFCCFLSLVSGM